MRIACGIDNRENNQPHSTTPHPSLSAPKTISLLRDYREIVRLNFSRQWSLRCSLFAFSSISLSLVVSTIFAYATIDANIPICIKCSSAVLHSRQPMSIAPLGWSARARAEPHNRTIAFRSSDQTKTTPVTSVVDGDSRTQRTKYTIHTIELIAQAVNAYFVFLVFFAKGARIQFFPQHKTVPILWSP